MNMPDPLAPSCRARWDAAEKRIAAGIACRRFADHKVRTVDHDGHHVPGAMVRMEPLRHRSLFGAHLFLADHYQDPGLANGRSDGLGVELRREGGLAVVRIGSPASREG